jgi:hypothetical protein
MQKEGLSLFLIVILQNNLEEEYFTLLVSQN